MFKKITLLCLVAVFCSCTNDYENDFDGYWRDTANIQSDYDYILNLLNNLSLDLENSEFWTDSSGNNHTFEFDYFTDESLQKYEEFSDLLNCPICLDMLDDPVECEQCSGTVCRKCLNVNDIDNCNLCRQVSVFRSSRNTVKFLDKFKFKCIFKHIGCNVESVYSNFDEHIKKCKSVKDLLQIINEQQSFIDYL